MDNNSPRERITLLLVNDALEANGQDIKEAIAHLLYAAGSLIVHSHKRTGVSVTLSADLCSQYLREQVERYTEGAA